jgi:hypothetical protein
MRKSSEKYTSDFTKKQKEYLAAHQQAEKLYGIYTSYFEQNEANMRNEVKQQQIENQNRENELKFIKAGKKVIEIME